MSEPKIEPEKITKPFQLLAVWFIGLIVLVGIFLNAASTISDPSWVQAVLVIAPIIFVLIFIGLVFLMQTKFRTQVLDDAFYAEWLKRQEKEFENFNPENVQISASDTKQLSNIPAKSIGFESVEEPELKRRKIYEQNQGLFLIHTWRPSRSSAQVVDISISLAQHGTGPLTEGKIKSVEYYLGPKFFRYPVRKTNTKENFRLDISAYGPVLCLARVNFMDKTLPLDLERYINFQNIPVNSSFRVDK